LQSCKQARQSVRSGFAQSAERSSLDLAGARLFQRGDQAIGDDLGFAVMEVAGVHVEEAMPDQMVAHDDRRIAGREGGGDVPGRRTGRRWIDILSDERWS
jgi:hypothetical protein